MGDIHGMQISMGNGDHSAAECYELHQDLERALALISGIQQPERPGSGVASKEADAKSAADQIELESIAWCLYERLTGNRLVDEQDLAHVEDEWETLETYTFYGHDHRVQVKRPRRG